MKGNILKDIIKKLDKKGFVELQPLCNECVGDIITELLTIYPAMKVTIDAIEDEIYCLRIFI